MKKPRLAKKFLEELSKIPIVSVACERLGLSRQTIYRWRDEDAEFSEKFDEMLEKGREGINDLAESKLISNINRGRDRSIEYWLSNNSLRFHRPKKAIDVKKRDHGSITINTFLNKKKIKTEIVR